jgi:hypothetical protein
VVVWWDPVKKKVIDAITHLLDDLGGSRNCGLFAGRAVGAARTMFSARRVLTVRKHVTNKGSRGATYG